jgi:hypothetical protein
MPDKTPDAAVHYGDDLGKKARLYATVNNKIPVVELKEIRNGGNMISMECGSFIHNIGEAVQFLMDAYHPDNHLLYWQITYQIGYGAAKGTVAEDQSGYSVEDFKGIENALVDWTYFDKDFGWVAESDSPPAPRPPPPVPPKPAYPCTIFGVSVEIAVCDKITDGESFIATYSTGHYVELHAGLAVSKATSS